MNIFLIFICLTTASAIEIGCRFYYTSWVVVGSQYTCEVTSMNFTGNATHITGYTGTHLPKWKF